MTRLTMLIAVVGMLVTGSSGAETAWEKIAPYFSPPAKFAGDFGEYRSPLVFDGGKRVKSVADWRKRRKEILDAWHKVMGAWPALVEKPTVETVQTKRRDGFTQKTVRVDIAAGRKTNGYLLVPDGPGRRPAVLVVYYDPETGAGLKPGQTGRDFGYALTKRGFVTLSIGWPRAEARATAGHVQPLSYLAYVAANCYEAMARLGEVDPKRIGVTGHSFGGKWAMLAACLYEKFACAAVSDPGIVFDEKRGNVNYWDPWYLGYEAGRTRKRGLPSKGNPAIGAYKRLVDAGRDLHELHALMAPRPFFVSGGAEDAPRRWKALNHTIAVNRLLGCRHRVGMTNRKGHSPTPESNEQLYGFFEHFLNVKGAAAVKSTRAERRR
jgi:hypothetical protein